MAQTVAEADGGNDEKDFPYRLTVLIYPEPRLIFSPIDAGSGAAATIVANHVVRHPRRDGAGSFNAAWRDWIEAMASP